MEDSRRRWRPTRPYQTVRSGGRSQHRGMAIKKAPRISPEGFKEGGDLLLTAGDCKPGAARDVAGSNPANGGTHYWVYPKKKSPLHCCRGLSKKAATYSPTWCGSTIGADGLNFPVRNGKGWTPSPQPPEFYVRSAHYGATRRFPQGNQYPDIWNRRHLLFEIPT